jgi:hypothetical protein
LEWVHWYNTERTHQAIDGCQGALGHTFCSWKRSNARELRIGVMNAVEGPYYVADQAQFT